jgi:hypothetical protein
VTRSELERLLLAALGEHLEAGTPHIHVLTDERVVFFIDDGSELWSVDYLLREDNKITFTSMPLSAREVFDLRQDSGMRALIAREEERQQRADALFDRDYHKRPPPGWQPDPPAFAGNAIPHRCRI